MEKNNLLIILIINFKFQTGHFGFREKDEDVRCTAMLCALVLYYAIIKINNHYATVSLVSVGYIF